MQLFILAAVCLQLGFTYGRPESASSFAYTDSSGNRYAGTYELKDGKVTNAKGHFPKNFQPFTFPALDDFFPDYFRNFDNLLREAFESNLANQRRALDAAQKAFQMTAMSNMAGFYPDFANRFGGPGDMAMGPNSAFAGAFSGPGYTRHIDAISPDYKNANIDIVDRFNGQGVGGPGYHSVASKSYSTSSNINGVPINNRGAETYVNNNGHVTGYKVQS